MDELTGLSAGGSASADEGNAGGDLRATLAGAFEADGAAGAVGGGDDGTPYWGQGAGDAPEGAGHAAQERPAAVPAAPQSWSPAAKAEWAALPDGVRREIAKRENDFSRGIEQKSREAKRYDGLEAVLGPRRAALANEFGSAEEGVRQLFALSDYAARDPGGFIRWYAQQRGMDLSQLATPAAAQTAPAGADREQGTGPHPLTVLQHRLGQLEAILGQQLQSQQLQAQQSLLSSMQAVVTDPAHPHIADVFDEVMEQIPAIRQARPDADPQDIVRQAYDRAVWLNPTVRDRLLEERQRQAAGQRQDQARAAATHARNAAVSITGAPTAGATPQGAPATTLRDELERNFRLGRA